MIKQIIVALTTEGTTDSRFLESIIQRSFENAAFDCAGQIEVLPVQYIEKQSGDFIEVVKLNAQLAGNSGVMVLCIHSDADDATDTNTFTDKINPAFTAVMDMQGKHICKSLVAIVPVHMTEAWMLSDTELLKAEIGTDKSDQEVGIDGSPEVYSDPKDIIEAVIRIARQDLTKRRRRDLTIGELYAPIGQKVSLDALENLPSYRKFREAVRDVLKNLNYLH